MRVLWAYGQNLMLYRRRTLGFGVGRDSPGTTKTNLKDSYLQFLPITFVFKTAHRIEAMVRDRYSILQSKFPKLSQCGTDDGKVWVLCIA